MGDGTTDIDGSLAEGAIADRIERICVAHEGSEGPLLPILHEVQTTFGCIDTAAETIIARCLNLSRAEVHGVVSYYHDFQAEPDPRPVVQICRAEACKARGVEKLVAGARAAAGDRARIEDVYCLGLCSVGPNARIGDQMHARLDAEALARLIDRA